MASVIVYDVQNIIVMIMFSVAFFDVKETG